MFVDMERALRHTRHSLGTNVSVWVIGIDESGLTFGGAARMTDVPHALASASTLCGVPVHHLHTVRQVHGSSIILIDKHQERTVPSEGDGLITTSPRQALAVTVADCAPVVLSNGTALCVVHSGWRGTAAGIAERGVYELRAIDPGAAIIAWIGPLACGPCYEVGEDVAAVFPDSVTPRANGRWSFDNRAELVRRLDAVNVSVVGHDDRCTICDTSLHSHRRQGVRAGRNLVIARMLDAAGGTS